MVRWFSLSIPNLPPSMPGEGGAVEKLMVRPVWVLSAGEGTVAGRLDRAEYWQVEQQLLGGLEEELGVVVRDSSSASCSPARLWRDSVSDHGLSLVEPLFLPLWALW